MAKRRKPEDMTESKMKPKDDQVQEVFEYATKLGNLLEFVAFDKESQVRFFYHPAHNHPKLGVQPARIISVDQNEKIKHNINVEYFPPPESCRTETAKKIGMFLMARGYEIGQEGVFEQMKKLQASVERKSNEKTV